MGKKIEWVALSPLALLLLLPLTFKIGAMVQDSASRQHIFALRYLAIPLAGFSLGASVFLAVMKGCMEDDLTLFLKYAEKRERLIVLSLSAVFLAVFSVLPLLRYYTLHSGFFDFGVYDTKLWEISVSPWKGKFINAATGHFQPVLVIYSFLYNLNIPPAALQVLQAASVTSAVIPLYLIARGRLKTPLFTVGVVLLFFLFPSTQFNSAIDFHPDHLYIPLIFWALYFIETGREKAAIFFILPVFLLKEPLMLGVAFLGLYLFFGKKKLIAGAFLFIFSTGVFLYVTFVVVPGVSGWSAGTDVVRNSPYFSHLTDGKWLYFFKEIIRVGKLRFPVMILLPFLFLPLTRPLHFLPALPAIVIALLSSSINHQSVSSHYTASIIPPAFLAFIYSVRGIEERFGKQVVFGLFSWILILTLSLNIAHSPSPASVGFWERDWSNGYWHNSMYSETSHEKALQEAIDLVPEDPEAKVATHNMVSHPRLAHRHFYRSYPLDWQEADYILLDNSRGPYMVDSIDEAGYRAQLDEVREDRRFKAVFDKDGVLLFRRNR